MSMVMPASITSERGSLLSLAVRELLERVAWPEEPAPAGGSVAALTAALSASLLMLVCHVTQRRGGGVHEFDVLGGRAEALRSRLARMVDSDAQAFQNLMAGGPLPRRAPPHTTPPRGAARPA